VSFTIVDVEQGSSEWHQTRAGRVTSSRADAMLAQGKGQLEAVSKRNLRVQLALEQIAGRSLDTDFLTAAMARGTEREPDARRAYEALTGQLVITSGFLAHDELLAGASLDGYLGAFAGICEFKCPEPAAHLESLTSGRVPLRYLRQITHQLWLTGAPFCEFVSWCPEFPERARLKVIRVQAADIDLAAYEWALRMFLSDVEQERQRIEGLAA